MFISTAIGGLSTIISFDMEFVTNLALQLLSTTILVAAIGFLLYKPVLKFLNNRSERIKNQVEGAERSLADAESLKKEYASKLKNIENERAAILSEGHKRAAEKEAQIIAEAKKEAELIMQRAQTNIQREQENAREEMKRQIIDISSILASRYIENSLDEKAQNKLIDEVISDLGDVTWLN